MRPLSSHQPPGVRTLGGVLLVRSARPVAVATAALLALVAAASGCGGTECGEGTIERDGQCVPPSGSAAAVRCGDGTEARDRVCVRVGDSCGPGTVASNGACVLAPEACGEGTVFDVDVRACVATPDDDCPGTQVRDPVTGTCVTAPTEDTLRCGPGTVQQVDVCIPLPADCPEGTIADGDDCRIPDTICGTGTVRDPITGLCTAQADGRTCGPGTQADEDGRCVVDPTACGPGTTFNAATETCTADVRCRPGDRVVDGFCVSDGVEVPAPRLTWPGDGATGLSPSVALVWQRPPGEPLDRTTEVQIATDAAFSNRVFDANIGTRLHVRPETLQPSTTYFWRARHHEGETSSLFSETRTFATGATTAERPVIYQLVVRHFGNTGGTNRIDGTIEQNGVGRFVDIDDRALETLRAMGATHIWLTGVLRQATGTDWSGLTPPLPADDPDLLKGRAGSFFAVRDYFDVSPDYAVNPEARLDEFADLIDRIHDAGMKAMIDLVPNHVARSYGSVVRPEWDLGRDDNQNTFFSPQNNFFYLQDTCALQLPASAWPFPGRDGAFPPEDGSAGRRVRVTGNNVASCAPSVNDWYETVKLNYGYDYTAGTRSFDPTPSTWLFMDEVIRYWQEDFGVDGFRVDFAHFVPTEFYAWAIQRARARDAGAVFVAEAYENLTGLLDAGFDAVYDDPTYDLLKGIYNGSHNKFELDAHFASISPDRRHQYVRYLENHDERRIASPLVPGVEPDESGFGTPAAGRHFGPVSYLVGNGPILFYNGQSVGELGAGVSGFSGDNGRSTIFDYWRVPALARWVNGGRFDGGELSDEARDLHEYYRRLLHLAQHPTVTGSGYWGLDFFNREQPDYPGGFYAFARFAPGAGSLLLVVLNLTPDASVSGRVRLPSDLLDAAGLPADVAITRVFTETGETTAVASGTASRASLQSDGVAVEVGNQGTRAWLITPR
jgi:glycosidase